MAGYITYVQLYTQDNASLMFKHLTDFSTVLLGLYDTNSHQVNPSLMMA